VGALQALKDLGCLMAENGKADRTAAFTAADKGHVEALRVLKDLYPLRRLAGPLVYSYGLCSVFPAARLGQLDLVRRRTRFKRTSHERFS
jgi:hypothetical protein